MEVGFLGLGNMGGALVRRLLQRQPLWVFDLQPQLVKTFAELGCKPVDSAEELARKCDFIMMCLPTSAHVEKALYAPSGILAGAKPGTLIADMTTGDPIVTRRLAKSVAADHGIEFIDAPVSGGPPGAAAGTIAIMVGGTKEQFAKAKQVFDLISPNSYHCGGIGNGHVMKIVNNVIHAGQKAMTFEALALGVRNGLSLDDCAIVLNKGSARNTTTEMTLVSMVEKTMKSTFTLSLMHKDVVLATQLGRETGVPMPIAGIVREMYQIGLTDPGPEEDHNLLVQVYERLANTRVLPL